MRRPGDRLRALAARVFDAETMERLIDPIVADLQQEYAEASRAGQIWRRRWVRLAGYIAFVRVTTGPLQVFLVVTLAAMLLMELPVLTRLRAKFVLSNLLYLAPQGLIVAVPIALTLAIGWGRRATRSRQSLAATLAAGAACSALVFVMLNWLVPSANQAFRVTWAKEAGMTYRPRPGPPEMTIGELRQQMTWAATGHSNWVHVNQRELVYTYYFRFAFGGASLSLAILMLALQRRVARRRRSLLLAAVPIFFVYEALMFFGREYALHSGVLQAAVGAWMPSVITVLTAAAIATIGTRRQVVE